MSIKSLMKDIRKNTGSTTFKESKYGEIGTWISTGDYGLNRILTGDIYKGIPSGKLTILGGESQSGKSFIAANLAADALNNQDFDMVFYFDSEGGALKEFFESRGCDSDKIEHILVESVEDATVKILNVYDKIVKYKETNPEAKFLCILDSLGELVPTKLIADAVDKGRQAQDMGLRAKLCVHGDTDVLMGDGSYKKIKDVKVGDYLMTHLKTPKKILEIEINLHLRQFILNTDNQRLVLSPHHRMLVKRDDELVYIRANELTTDDKLMKLDKYEIKTEQHAAADSLDYSTVHVPEYYEEVAINSIDIEEERHDMWDVEVESNHTLCLTTDNIVSHNCNNLVKGLTIPALKSDTAMVIVNHVYDDPASMFPSKVKAQGGGKGIQYTAHLSIQCSKRNQKSESGEESAFKASVLKFFTVKNRIVKPFFESEMFLDFSTGPMKYFGLLEPAKRYGFVEQRGAYYVIPSYSEKNLRLKAFIDNDEIWETFLDDLNVKFKEDMSYSGHEVPDDYDNLEALNNQLEQTATEILKESEVSEAEVFKDSK